MHHVSQKKVCLKPKQSTMYFGACMGPMSMLSLFWRGSWVLWAWYPILNLVFPSSERLWLFAWYLLVINRWWSAQSIENCVDGVAQSSCVSEKIVVLRILYLVLVCAQNFRVVWESIKHLSDCTQYSWLSDRLKLEVHQLWQFEHDYSLGIYYVILSDRSKSCSTVI